MKIRRWNSREPLPWVLLLDADPSRVEVLKYLARAHGQLQFYQRFGFRIHGVDRGYFIGRYANEEQEEDGVILEDMIRLQMPS